MNVQAILRDGEPEYAVIPWAEYQALLQAAGRAPAPAAAAATEAAPRRPALAELAALRQARGVDAQQLARAAGISPAYLEMIERGERSPDGAIRRSLALALGVDGWSDPS